MTKRRLAWIALAVVAALVVVGLVWSAFGATTIVLTAPQLQERVNRALPRDFKGVTVERATVTIAESRIALRVEVRALGGTLRTAVSARGVPRYDAAEGAIFFEPEDVKVEEDGGALTERLSTRLGDRAQTIRNAVATGMTAYLVARPVYRFKDDLKGIVVKAALADIAMQPDAIVVTLSVVKLSATIGVGLAALLVIVVLLIQLLRHPRWGAAAGRTRP
jgi:Protein of unknown function (DUF1439)